MPILSVLVNQNPGPEQRTRLFESATQAVVDSLGSPVANVRVSLETIAPEDGMIAGVQGEPMALVKAYLLPGRTEEQREALIGALSAAVESSLGVTGNGTRIIIHDIPLTDLGMGGISAKKAGR